MGRDLRIAFIGAGGVNFGSPTKPWDHATRLEKLGGVTVVGVADPDMEKAQKALAERLAGPARKMYAGAKAYADERRTGIVHDEGEIDIEDLIADQGCVITISHTGYIKRNAISNYRKQRRGGKGVTGADMKEEDFIEHLFIASTHDYMLFFTDKGIVHWLKVHEIGDIGFCR